MSDAIDADALLARLIGIGAARLLLRLPEARAPLLDLARAILPTDELDPAAIAIIIPDAADILYEELATADVPLGRIARACALSAFDLDLLGLALLPALDDRAAALISGLSGTRRLPAGVALRLLLGDKLAPIEARRAVWASPLWRHGLLRWPETGAPATDWLLDPQTSLLAVLDATRPTDIEIAELTIGDEAGSDDDTALALSAWLATPDSCLLHLAGEGWRGEALLQMAAPTALVVQSSGVPPWRMLAMLSVAEQRPIALAWTGSGELGMPPDDLIAPIILLAPADIFLRTTAHQRPPARIILPPPDAAIRIAHWRRAMPNLDEAEVNMLANQSWMRATDIAMLASRARGDPKRLAAARMETVPPRAVRMASLRVPRVAWNQLVIDATTESRLEDFIRRYRLRIPIRNNWELDRERRGLCALISGDSGVGKTLATDAIATRLGLPVMQVDLSLVVSKYIGETEKNLSELFAAAEGFCALLFFDEADSLFGKRTSVEDAHDRYANIEVNFLLQRLEAFDGIAILASNLAQGIDEAFMRRLDSVVPMPRPAAAQRLRLWQLHLPAETRLTPRLPLDLLARHCEMTGGEIRNAALAAAYAAADEDRRITTRDLQEAIMTEFAKKGRPAPLLPIATEGAA
ncbi:ATP-binding protein [Sphingobium sp. AP49]|uniref:ATP-binding protein n=1 Tax=Sphingobium sp. AP49 TaxID=1144307 RepID=UPI00026ECEC6|nr:ATP-binding protein [Sphingobium sp. AP49]WHO39149.1 ATP-binding protein [Sphingobium sp. AP49]